MIGLLLVLFVLATVVVVAKALATRFSPDPFFVLCASAFLGLLAASFVFDRARAGNEFGPLAEIVFFYPIGLGFWIAGLVALVRARGQDEPLGRFRTTLQGVTGFLYLGPLLAIGWQLVFPPTEYVYDLIVELRAPSVPPSDPLTRVFLHSYTDRSEVALGKMKPREEGAFTVYSGSFGLNNRESGRILVVQRPEQPFQVFRPPIPEDLKAEDWTTWQRPDYTQTNVEDWRILNESSQHERSANLPADCFELHYKIEKSVLEPWKPPKK